MSTLNYSKSIIPLKLILSDWEKVLRGDVELFEQLTSIHITELLAHAAKVIRQAKRSGDLPSEVLHPEELVGETLIMAWKMRHGRPKRSVLKHWLVEVQKYALQKVIDEEQKFYEPIAVSLEEPAPLEPEIKDENEFWDWIEPPVRDRWEDIIPDEHVHHIAA